MIENFNDFKQSKERGVSVKETLQDALSRSHEIDTIVIISKMKNKTVETAYSWDSSLEALGMVEVGKQGILYEMEQ